MGGYRGILGTDKNVQRFRRRSPRWPPSRANFRPPTAEEKRIARLLDDELRLNGKNTLRFGAMIRLARLIVHDRRRCYDRTVLADATVTEIVNTVIGNQLTGYADAEDAVKIILQRFR